MQQHHEICRVGSFGWAENLHLRVANLDGDHLLTFDLLLSNRLVITWLKLLIPLLLSSPSLVPLAIEVLLLLQLQTNLDSHPALPRTFKYFSSFLSCSHFAGQKTMYPMLLHAHGPLFSTMPTPKTKLHSKRVLHHKVSWDGNSFATIVGQLQLVGDGHWLLARLRPSIFSSRLFDMPSFFFRHGATNQQDLDQMCFPWSRE